MLEEEGSSLALGEFNRSRRLLNENSYSLYKVGPIGLKDFRSRGHKSVLKGSMLLFGRKELQSYGEVSLASPPQHSGPMGPWET